MNARRGPAVGAPIGLLLIGALAAGCRQNMVEQSRVDAYEPSPVFADGTSVRLPPPDTIARNDTWARPAGADAAASDFPFPITAGVLQVGRERFDIYCSPCHGRTGEGNGIIVQRGFVTPPSLFTPALVAAPASHFVDVMTNGFSAMPPYDYLVPMPQRWAIAAYIRALQMTRPASIDALPASLRQRLVQEAPQ